MYFSYFSDAVATNDSRQLFAENIALVYKTFGIDGIDIDWEYPGHQGDSANVVSHQDALNFLAFLRILRAALPAGAVITAATQPVPFVGEDGQPMRDVSEFAMLLDWILIMNYDVHSCKTPLSIFSSEAKPFISITYSWSQCSILRRLS